MRLTIISASINFRDRHQHAEHHLPADVSEQQDRSPRRQILSGFSRRAGRHAPARRHRLRVVHRRRQLAKRKERR